MCVGTLILTNPLNPLAGFALSQIDAAISLYTAVVQGRGSRRMIHNLQWLLKLRQRASDRIARAEASAASAGRGQGSEAGGPGQRVPSDSREGEGADEGSDSEEVELLGWRTRLIQRASGRHGPPTQTATTITLPSPLNSGTSTSPNAAVQATVANALAAHFEPLQTSPNTDASTEALVSGAEELTALDTGTLVLTVDGAVLGPDASAGHTRPCGQQCTFSATRPRR